MFHSINHDARHASNLSRRELLQRTSNGFGAMALSSALSTGSYAESSDKPPTAKAKHVVFCYMSGGVSHVDSFDPKPKLAELHGQPMPVEVERTQFNNNGNIMKSPFQFIRQGQSGIPISEIFPKIGQYADEMAVIRSMTSTVNEHAQGNFLMHSGFPIMGYPTAGAWCSYGLGSGNEDLPSYVVLQSGSAVPPHGGVSLYSNGFLPAQHQGSILKADKREAIRNLVGSDTRSAQRRRLDFTRSLDTEFSISNGEQDQVEAAITNLETAFRMQTAVPDVCDISGETKETRDLYGVDSNDAQMAAYARQCLLARRLIQKGVRFIELSCLTRGIGAGGAPNPWDQHSALEHGHREMAKQVDQPIAALMGDLKRLGLLEETLIVWAGEFGRTPFSQGSNGRDHNPFGFSIWMAGAGIKGGSVYGKTDELGYHAIEDRCEVYDMWATTLHLMGMDHHQLTYRHAGRDFRLTDVHGNVLTPILS